MNMFSGSVLGGLANISWIGAQGLIVKCAKTLKVSNEPHMRTVWGAGGAGTHLCLEQTGVEWGVV